MFMFIFKATDVTQQKKAYRILEQICSRASQSVVDSLCLCAQLLKASRGGITLFCPTNLRGTANIVSVYDDCSI